MAATLLGREDLKLLVDKVRETSPTLVSDMIRRGGVHGYVCNKVCPYAARGERADLEPDTHSRKSWESASDRQGSADSSTEFASTSGARCRDRFRDAQGKLGAIMARSAPGDGLKRSVTTRI